jgi:hypothetical protein
MLHAREYELGWCPLSEVRAPSPQQPLADFGKSWATSVPNPKFASFSGALVCELRIRRTLENLEILVWFGSEIRLT